MQHPTAPTESAMSQPIPNPNVPLPGVPAQIWAAMSPAEKAKLYADQANTQAVVQAQHQASQRTKNTLVVIFVVIPAVIVLLVIVVSLLTQMG